MATATRLPQMRSQQWAKTYAACIILCTVFAFSGIAAAAASSGGSKRPPPKLSATFKKAPPPKVKAGNGLNTPAYNPNDDPNTYACGSNGDCQPEYYCAKPAARCAKFLKVLEVCAGNEQCETGLCKRNCAGYAPAFCKFTCAYKSPPPSPRPPPPSPPPTPPPRPEAPPAPEPVYCSEDQECLNVFGTRPSTCRAGLCTNLLVGDEICTADEQCASGTCFYRCKRDTTCARVCKPSAPPPGPAKRPPSPRKPPAPRRRPPGYWEDSWANGRKKRARSLRGVFGDVNQQQQA